MTRLSLRNITALRATKKTLTVKTVYVARTRITSYHIGERCFSSDVSGGSDSYGSDQVSDYEEFSKDFQSDYPLPEGDISKEENLQEELASVGSNNPSQDTTADTADPVAGSAKKKKTNGEKASRRSRKKWAETLGVSVGVTKAQDKSGCS